MVHSIDSKAISVLKESFIKKEVVFKDNLLLLQAQPHTAPIADLKECSDGVATAHYYFISRYFNLIDDDKAASIVSEIKKLQNTDENSNYFGCMRWYREEEFISDSNGAFFVLLPIALTYKLCKDKITQSEKDDIFELLEKAAIWFVRTTKGTLNYTNKILSDGAMLTLIAEITQKHYAECEEFWNRWHNYADNHGWGWGENTSDCYSSIMLNALNVTILASRGEIKEKAIKRRSMLIDYIAFHGGKEFIPSIRTYNFSAVSNYGGGVRKAFMCPERIETYRNMSDTIVMYETKAEWNEEINLSCTRNENVYEDSYAYTWKNNDLRLGSITHFPVMPCSYQNSVKHKNGYVQTYGLGWQSMPVSAMVGDFVSFLRIRTRVGESEHSHPAVNKHNAYLFNRLFEDGNITVFSTIANQDNNIAVVSRYANKLANTSSFICDEWCVSDKSAEICEKEINGKIWYIVKSESGSIALCQLDGIGCGDRCRGALTTYISDSDNFRTITTEFYSGENKMLFSPRLESVWVIVAINPDRDVEACLTQITITDETVPDFEVSRSSCYKKRRIVCTDGKSKADLLIDPLNQNDF